MLTFEVLQFLAAPFCMSLILAGMHCYLGLHVLARGVVFVDLSLAQIAALGASVALIFGFQSQSLESYFISLIGTFLASILFAMARRHEKAISQEALIGIVYALGSAGVVLVIDKASHGAEHLKDLLVGQILWVTWGDVFKTGMIYLAVAAVHFLFRRQLIRSSFSRTSHWSWDLLFYALFGVIITSSVRVAGVLQVFAYLIVPAMMSSLWASSLKARLWSGWALGFLMSAIGMTLSYTLDAPAGAMIVVCFTALPVLAVVGLSLRR